MSHRILQQITVPASPSRVYDILMDSSQFSAMAGGAPADIDPANGGRFSLFGGMIVGRTVEGIAGVLLVQAWRAKTWEQGVYSIVRFELTQEGEGTQIALDHAGFPDSEREHLETGWHENYWQPMLSMLAPD